MFLAGHQIWDRPDLVPRLFAASRHLHFLQNNGTVQGHKEIVCKKGCSHWEN